MPELWRPVVGYENLYEVSDQGNVRSVDRYVPGKTGPQFKKGVSLKPGVNIHGYIHFRLSGRTLTAHSLVAAAFIGERPKGCVIDHLNEKRSDNRAMNLEYVTQAENIRRWSARRQERLQAGLNRVSLS